MVNFHFPISLANIANTSRAALIWLARLNDSRLRESTPEDWNLSPRTIRQYIKELADGDWIDIKTEVGANRSIHYIVPSAPRSPSTAFADAWRTTSYAATIPCDAARYDSLRALFPEHPEERFVRALRSKLIEAAGNPSLQKSPQRAQPWLRRGLRYILAELAEAEPTPKPADHHDTEPSEAERALRLYDEQIAAAFPTRPRHTPSQA